MNTATHVSAREMESAILQLNKIAMRESKKSALRGLTVVTCALAGLLDIYAQPNDENDQGMCDDPVAFRKHFAEILVEAPILKKKVKLT